MTELLTSAQMRAVEQAEIACGRVTGEALMERAGQAVAGIILAEGPGFARSPGKAALPGRAVVLCGPGNNGGDGFVVARHLAAAGWALRVLGPAAPDRLPPDARRNHDRWAALGPVLPLEDAAGLAALDWLGAAGAAEPRLLVDALFGAGLARRLTLLPGLRRRLALRDLPVLAVDLPSGLSGDTGAPPPGAADDAPPVIAADLTVTFHRAFPGHFLAGGAALTGRLVVADIGLPDALPESLPARLPEAPALQLLGPPARVLKRAGHKYDHGHLLVIGGGVGRGGAARMAARAALRTGAGLVTLACPPAALQENAMRLDAVMLRALRDGEARDEVAGLAALLQDRRLGTLLLGPGAGIARAAALLPLLLDSRRPAVLDADALSALAADPGLRAGLHGACLLTPHDGEFARLFPELAAGVADGRLSRAAAARAAARQSGAVVLLKGPDTLIAAPEGALALHAALGPRAAPWLATAGAGDVLAGIAAGLMARGLCPFEAGCSAAWLHVEAALQFGPGLIAEDLPEALPAVFRALAREADHGGAGRGEAG